MRCARCDLISEPHVRFCACGFDLRNGDAQKERAIRIAGLRTRSWQRMTVGVGAAGFTVALFAIQAQGLWIGLFVVGSWLVLKGLGDRSDARHLQRQYDEIRTKEVERAAGQLSVPPSEGGELSET
ncbi:MAG: hypothetical protein RMA76_35090 [Deltaproteobacteria bacterium]|jgi:hypothetical protein